jgi:NAD(P)H-hydrate epimerase
MKLATAAQMKELDRQAIEERKIPSIDLMERAAEGVFKAVLEMLPERPGKCRVAVFCGAGNNGGDGIAAARMLHMKGVRVRAFLVGSFEKMTPDAMEETRRLSESGVELELYKRDDLSQSAWARGSHVLVDAIFGVGLSREVAPDSLYASAINLINECQGKVVAADIVSGLSADTGLVLGCAVRADRTITFTQKKVGQVIGEGEECSGDVTVWEIGIPVDLQNQTICSVQTIEKEFASDVLPKRKVDGHKGTFGKVLVVGGAVGYTGAPYLTASAAVRTGCGLVYLGVPAVIWAAEAAKCVSAMPFPLADKDGALSHKALPDIYKKLNGCDVLALGPGLARTSHTEKLVWELLTEVQQPIVLDADGINALEGHIDVLDRRKGRVTILTPHDGEFARLGGNLSQGRITAARSFAQDHGCILVLKGHRTVIATPEGNVLVNTTGNSGLAKGGSGDVLTGMIASFVAQGATAVQAAALGVWMHGRAGDFAADRLTEYAMTPTDVIESLPDVFKEL